MAYRIYVLGATGRIIIRLHVNCSSDNAAIMEARKYAIDVTSSCGDKGGGS